MSVPEVSQAVELCILLDCTGSMCREINTIRYEMKEVISSLIETQRCNIQVSLLEFRDHSHLEPTFLVKTHPFTRSIKEFDRWFEEAEGFGGGDIPEGITQAIYVASTMSWQEESIKICILVTDAPPHGLHTEIDSMPEGNERDLVKLVKDMNDSGFSLYVLGRGKGITPYQHFYEALAHLGGGQYFKPYKLFLFSKVLKSDILAEINLQKMLEELREDVEGCESMDLDELIDSVYSRFRLKGPSMRSRSHKRISKKAQLYLECNDLKEMRSIFEKEMKSPLHREDTGDFITNESSSTQNALEEDVLADRDRDPGPETYPDQGPDQNRKVDQDQDQGRKVDQDQGLHLKELQSEFQALQ
ncbi:DgyrCDS1484 [Dimorphilus gyrociliatus]|uniref:DgyrCDS1484 n=1 Tax=Dimorphilus gyrociliatus TaxID=2664684 RepID=A0A7I8V9K6_9ANNE|nr:DgyrCDS1484 [Dimorphilus gyrociliatus]